MRDETKVKQEGNLEKQVIFEIKSSIKQIKSTPKGKNDVV